MRPRLVLVTDPFFGDEAILRCVSVVGRALPRGALCVQLRDKGRLCASLRVFASAMRELTRKAGASLVVNGDARIARDVGADGVHLAGGAGSVAAARATFGRPAWISVAVHSDEDARRAAGDGADALLVSPIFATRPASPLARAKAPRGVEAIRSARAAVAAPVALYALGGITPERVPACARAGADGVAVVRALLASARPDRDAVAIHDALARRW